MNTNPIIHRVEAELPPVGMKLVLLVPQSGVKGSHNVESVSSPSQTEDGEFIAGLQWKMEDGSLVPIRPSDFWTYHPSLTAVIKLENELSDAVRDAMEYKAISTYLADCEATTACGVGSRLTASKCNKKRHADTCRLAIAMIESGCLMGTNNPNQRYTSKEGIKNVMDRCRESADLCEGKKA